MTTLDQELSNQAPKGPTALTIGTFDGVHLGHQDLLSRLKALASDRGLHTAVLTFRRHPRLALTPGIELRYITTLEERLGLLRDSGIDLVAVVDFTRDVALLKAGEFLEMLCRRLNTKGLVVGPDFALGNNREGDIPTLRRLGGEMGFWVEPVEPVVMDKTVIRSSVIRSLLVQGEVEGAGAMLGRTYGVTGPVVEGDRRGRTLGFPRPTCPWTATWSCPWTASTPPGPSWTGGGTGRRPTWGCARPSAGAPASSRRTCWTSTATCTANN